MAQQIKANKTTFKIFLKFIFFILLVLKTGSFFYQIFILASCLVEIW